MPDLSTLQSKRRDRVRKRDYHFTQQRKFKKAGKRVRQAWQGRKFRAQVKAIAKLDRLIKDAVEARKIDWSGKPPVTHEPLLAAVRLALNVADGLYVSSTTGGTHSPTSWHYSGHAVDFGSGGPGESPEIEAQNALLNTFGAGYFAELFGPDSWHIKNGVIKPGTFPNHGDHLHVAVA